MARMRPAPLLSIALTACTLAIAACDKPAPAPVKAGPATAFPPTPGDPGRGRRVYASMGCGICHAISGTNPQGPTLANYWMTVRKLSDGREIITDEAYTRRAIMDPQSEIVPGYPAPMTVYKGLMNDEQLTDLVAYIKSLSNP
jgi:mono/diheme cytochrome c family protein